MKLLDQYIYAIGKKLPFRSRNEIKKELRSLLLDDIEAKYGEHPTGKQVEEVIMQNGSPREVANRYKNHNMVIGEQYTDLFFFIAKIIVLALALAFTVVFVIELVTSEITGPSILMGIGKIMLNVFNASFAAFGWLTVVFILISRFYKGDEFDLDDDWTPKELKDIQITPEGESRIESAISIFFLLLMVVIINLAPQLVNMAERSFESSGLTLGHYIQLDVFRTYLLPLSVIWIGQIIYFSLNLFAGRSKKLALYDLLLELAGLVIMFMMFFNMNLYDGYRSILGFRAIFLLVAVIGCFESLGKLFRFLKYYVLEIKD